MPDSDENTISVVVEQPAEPQPYRMPRPEVGNIVVWYRIGKPIEGEAPKPAVVMRVNNSSVDLLFMGGSSGKFTVPHISDPRMVRQEFATSEGSWDFATQSGGPTHAQWNEYKSQVQTELIRLNDQIEKLQLLVMPPQRKVK